MPKPPPPLSDALAQQLQRLGAQLRAQRKALEVNATVAAESAGLSRVTVHRIEKGEPSVTMGAWAHLASVLGLRLALEPQAGPWQPPDGRRAWLPAEIVLADHPQLRALAWQVHGLDALTPAEAFDIYERNARHLDLAAMPSHEREVWQALQNAFAARPGRV